MNIIQDKCIKYIHVYLGLINIQPVPFFNESYVAVNNCVNFFHTMYRIISIKVFYTSISSLMIAADFASGTLTFLSTERLSDMIYYFSVG